MRKNVLLYSSIFLLICAMSIQTLTAQKTYRSKSLEVTRSSVSSEAINTDALIWDNAPKAACDTLNYYQYQNTWTIVDYSVTAAVFKRFCEWC
jgi:hypothetical protein